MLYIATQPPKTSSKIPPALTVPTVATVLGLVSGFDGDEVAGAGGRVVGSNVGVRGTGGGSGADGEVAGSSCVLKPGSEGAGGGDGCIVREHSGGWG